MKALEKVKLTKKEQQRVKELVLRFGYSEEQATWFCKMHKVLNDSTDGYMDGRHLYEVLELKQDFTDWIKKQLELVDAAEEKDFSLLKGESTGGRPSNEYSLTIRTAKHIAMTVGTAPRTNERTKEISKQVRDYFILCEELAHSEELWHSTRKDNKELQKEMMSMYTEAMHRKYGDRKITNYGEVQEAVYYVVFDLSTKEIKEQLGTDKKQPIPDWVMEKHDKALSFVYERMIMLFELDITNLEECYERILKSFDRKFGGVIKL